MARLPIESSHSCRVVLDGRELDYFGGCGYLALAHHPRVVDALRAGALQHGVSAGASRETTGNTRTHERLESELAQVFGCEAALLLPEGYTANLAAAQSLAVDHAVALVDERSHPSLFDAAALARLETQRVPHADIRALRRALDACGSRRAVLMTDSVFPSRGVIAPLREWSELALGYCATLLVDDCHGTGVLGASGRGALEHAGIGGEHVLLTSTLSKALGCYGGFLAGSADRVARARAVSHVYVGTTPIPPALAEAARVALDVAFGSGELVAQLRANLAVMRAGLARLGIACGSEELPVFAFALDTAEAMKALEAKLLDEGILAPYIRYPGGPPEGNFRIVISAGHSLVQIERLLDALSRLRSGVE
jgi:7-keto-8-aminopelargonate synthetase-like enzyme